MITVEEATNIIQSNLLKTSTVEVSFTQAIGYVVAEPILADRDWPPFDRATMDGIAVAHEALNTQSAFSIQSTQAAGEPQQILHCPNHCIEIMTGAVLPQLTDTIIPYEQITIKNKIATIDANAIIEKGQNIHRQGTDAQKGKAIVKADTKLSPTEIAILAAVGKNSVKVFQWPKIAIVSTGNELVEVNQTPLAHQIRKSNSYALMASLKAIGCAAELFHLPDDKNILEEQLAAIIQNHEVIILSGGVSKGKFDFVPHALKAIGIQQHFHQVAQKPGKPFWFGSIENKYVFGLPGNPVSTYMCFHRYVLPWLRKSLGIELHQQYAILANDFTFQPHLTYFLQVKIKNVNGCWMAYPHSGQGSGDFANLTEIDGFLELPKEKQTFAAGSYFPVFMVR